jgi:hypothetical protein
MSPPPAQASLDVSLSCPVLMREGKPCGRPVVGSILVGGHYVCFMHILDAGKDKNEFQNEIERILTEAGTGVADFTEFVFPAAQYAGREFKPSCVFGGAKFVDSANFSEAVFMQDADFFGVSFSKTAEFVNTTFKQGAVFARATFALDANFFEATFEQDAGFYFATFTQEASFPNAMFTRGANFLSATFTQDARFDDARFIRDTFFASSEFRGPAIFGGALFKELSDFSKAKFFGPVEFLRTKFPDDPRGVNDKPGPVFSRTKFFKPEEVVFYRTYLGQALFHFCDVTRINFSDVTWRKRRRSGKRMAFEEEVDLEHSDAEAIKPTEGSRDGRNRVLIAELYQQLKKNYDDRRDYWTAGDFHYGEMEMKRLSSRRENPLLRWLKARLGLVAWYKYASEYGESYVRPAWILGLVLLAFGLSYPIAGLRYDSARESLPAVNAPAEPVDADTYAEGEITRQDVINASGRPEVIVLTYRNPISISGAEQGQVGIWRGRLRLVGHSLLAAILVPLFQRDLVYEPAYPWGRVLAVLEIALTSTLFALFLLAVRRQFRR